MATLTRAKAKAHATKQAAELQSTAAAATDRGRAAERERLTKYLFVEPDKYGERRDVTIGEAPTHARIVVALPQDVSMSFRPYDPMQAVSKRIVFRAVRQAWSDGRGTTVHWWAWEFAG